MRKHTRGPWRVGKRGMDRDIYADHQTAFVHAKVLNGGLNDETEANARLIASAPTMLAVLQEIAEDIRCGLIDPISDRRVAVFAALRNATGENIPA